MKLEHAAGIVTLKIYGDIVVNDDKFFYEWLGYECTCPKDVEDALLAANGGAVTVKISSNGGDIVAASQIYTALRQYTGAVSIEIVGLAASAASVIATAARCEISPTAMIMVHNVQTVVQGDHRDMAHAAELLKSANETVVNAYCLKTGKDKAELLALMEKETWLSADEALEHRFVDGILFAQQAPDPKALQNHLRNTYHALVAAAPVLTPAVKAKIQAAAKGGESTPPQQESAILMAKQKIEVEKQRYGGQQ